MDTIKRRGRPRKDQTTIPTVQTSQDPSPWPEYSADSFKKTMYETQTPATPQPTVITRSKDEHMTMRQNATGQTPSSLKFQTQAQYLHHLFKLAISKFKSNKAPDGFEPDWQDNEHIHWFHTIDSNGKTILKSTSVGGHYHKMEVIEQGEGKAPIVKCVSGPLKEVSVVKFGKRTRVEVPANDVDSHSHSVEYVKSNVIVERQRNIEAAKVEAAIMAKYQMAVPGVESGD